MRTKFSRRKFLAASVALGFAGCKSINDSGPSSTAEPIIDIHQHTNYLGRSNADLFRHQQAMGVTTTVLLPAGRYYGLDAQCGGNESVLTAARKYPKTFVYFTNEVPYLDEAEAVIRKYLHAGALGIGEQKFRVLADSAYLDRIAGIARDFNVPILLRL
jgi:hypothetical protein